MARVDRGTVTWNARDDAEDEPPNSFDDVFDLIDRLGHVEFTGDAGPTEALEQHAELDTWARITANAVRTLNSYADRVTGNDFGGSVEASQPAHLLNSVHSPFDRDSWPSFHSGDRESLDTGSELVCMTPTVLLTICDDPDAGLVAQRLLRRGCRVAVAGLDVGTLLDAVRGYGAGQALVIVGDTDDDAEMARIRSVAEKAFGPIDVVIPDAGTCPATELASVSHLPVRVTDDRPRVDTGFDSAVA